MTKIKAIGFDFGGVVGGDPSLGHLFTEASAKLLGITTDQWREYYFLTNHLLNSGAISSKEDYWRQFLQHFNQPDKFAAQLELDRSLAKQYMVVNTQIIGLVDSLRQKGYKVGLLSNANAEVKQNILALNIAAHFDSLLFSVDLALQKPDPRSFLALASSLGVDITELAFVDDAERSLSTAAKVGYTPILYSSIEQLHSKLKLLDISY